MAKESTLHSARRLPMLNVVQVTKQTLAPLRKESPPPAQAVLGFFTDTSICIGCKACEVDCKQWNQLPATAPNWSGTSYDNTQQLGATTWRHVQFIEQLHNGYMTSEPYTPVLP